VRGRRPAMRRSPAPLRWRMTTSSRPTDGLDGQHGSPPPASPCGPVRDTG
jgi:hypothetical protein